MFKVTKLMHLAPGAGDTQAGQIMRQLRMAADQTGAERSIVDHTLPGALNGGDILLHLQFAAREAWQVAAPRIESILTTKEVAHVDGVEYWGDTQGRNASGEPGSVYRTLLLRVTPDTPDAVIARFEADLLSMPRHISAIKAWQLSRVERAVGSAPWTHVWEQEFTDIDALMGDYMIHPIHWAYVDRWFDPECPEVIVRDRICHSFCKCGSTVIA